MTEALWQTTAQYGAMRLFMRKRGSARKWRLFGVACCRQVWDKLDSLHQRTVELAERYADGDVPDEELRQARSMLHAMLQVMPEGQRRDVTSTAAAAVLPMAAMAGWSVADQIVHVALGKQQVSDEMDYAQRSWAERQRTEPPLLRCIFGNPFRPVRIDPAWLAWNDGTVRRIAEGIYDERAFDRLPILADALLDAGCDDEQLLEHCRSAGPHARGCWVVDALLGRE